MPLPFPTGHTAGRYPLGYPLKPQPRHLCHCGPQMMLDEDERCCRCGRFPKSTVDRTWHERAEQIAARGRKRKAGR